MAKIIGPAELAMPGVSINGVPLLLPADIPEGGTVQIVGGASPLGPISTTITAARGCMVGMFAAEVVAAIFPNLKPKADDQSAAVQMPNMDLFGIPLLGLVWCPVGGFLNVVVGPNPLALPMPSTPIVAGAIVCIVPPGPAEKFREGVEAMKNAPNPYAIVPDADWDRPS